MKYRAGITAAAIAAIFCCICSACASKNKNLSEVTLTYACNVGYNSETPFVKELEKKTGINLEFINVFSSDTNINEKMRLLYLTESLPDIVESTWSRVDGGAIGAYRNGYIIRLDELMKQYSPNLCKYLDEHPQAKKNVYFADGENDGYYLYPFIRGDSRLMVYNGLCVRSDWLEECGLTLPETLDEWHNVLQTFKTKYNCKTPLGLNAHNPVFLYAYGIINGFYINNGEVMYGYSRPEYKEYLQMMNNWYNEGLLGENYPNEAYDSDYMGGFEDGLFGAAYVSTGYNMGSILKNGISIEGTSVPVKSKGQRPFSGHYDADMVNVGAAAISTDCKNPEAAARLLDFGYGKEGMLLYNFGVEGESYVMSEEGPKYTDLITKSRNTGDEMKKYLRAFDSGPFVQMWEYMEQYAARPEQKRALERWSQTDAAAHSLPELTFTEEENKILSQLSFNSYAHEMELNFIMGITDLSQYDNYLKELSYRGADKALEIYRGAYARYCSK